MNKQEAIEKIKKDNSLTGGLVEKSWAIYCIEQIHEPQKPVVPKFVAEWINGMKQDERHLYSVMISLMNKTDHEWAVWKSANMNFSEIVAQAWIYGYEIEHWKLYTVEIPNPNSPWKYTFLTNRGPGVSIDSTDGDFWKDDSKNQLTEAEIKQDFDFLWQFAKEVEDN